jgi:hypothetical protein
VALLGLLLLAAACSGADAGAIDIDPTVTPRTVATTAVVLPPTSTAINTPTPDIKTNPDYEEGQRALEAKEFDEAVRIFQRLYQQHPTDEVAQTALATALRARGVDAVNNSNAEPEKLNEANGDFVSGLRVAPEGSDIHDALNWEKEGVELYLQVIRDRQALEEMQAENADLATQMAQVEEIIALFAEAKAEYAHLPGLITSYADTLKLASDLQRDMADLQEARDEKLPYWEQARQYCEQAINVVGSESDAAKPYNGCVDELSALITPPTPTPTPLAVPTTPPDRGGGGGGGGGGGQQLIQIPDVRGSDVGQARGYLQSLGFGVAVSALGGDQTGHLCNGQVSYVHPVHGSWATRGTTVRLFYRDYNLENPPGCQ